MKSILIVSLCMFLNQAQAQAQLDKVSKVKASSCASQTSAEVLADFSSNKELVNFKNDLLSSLGSLYRAQRSNGTIDDSIEAEFVEALEACYLRTLGL